MIRDPSDGSVKEITKDANEINSVSPKTLSKEITPSGLPAGSTKPAQIERLNESRTWLKDYHAKRLTCGLANASPAKSTD